MKSSRNKFITQEEFENRVRKIHGDKLDLSKAIYFGKDKKVTIICHEHGEFKIAPSNIWRGTGCPICNFMYDSGQHASFWKLCTTEQKTKWCIEKMKIVHGGKYDYSLIKEINKASDIVEIICPKHGVFKQDVLHHLIGNGCMKCSGKEKLTHDEFERRVKEINGEQIDVSESVYTARNKEVICRCIDHGYFNITPEELFNGRRCPVCEFLDPNRTKTYRFWKDLTPDEKAKWVKLKLQRIHGDKYDYSRITNVNNHFDEVEIGCPIHGFDTYVLNYHLCGNGCRYCNDSTLERDLRISLKDNNINHIQRATFDWLGKQHFDFYLPEYNIAIECQGGQHFHPEKHFGGEDGFLETVNRDVRKYNLSQENGVTLYYLLPKRKVHIDKANSIQEIYKNDNTFLFIETLINKIREAL